MGTEVTSPKKGAVKPNDLTPSAIEKSEVRTRAAAFARKNKVLFDLLADA